MSKTLNKLVYSILEAVCKCCEESKPLSKEYWYTAKTNLTGFDGTCKVCRNKRKSELYSVNPEKNIECQRVYREKNRDMVNAKQNEYRKKRVKDTVIGEIIRRKAREYYADNSKMICEWQKERREGVDKEKNKEYGRRHYLENKEKILQRTKLAREANREEWLFVLKWYGYHRCKLCGYNKSFAAIDFHHTDPESKKYAPATIIQHKLNDYKLDYILNNTIPLCSNCHREHHLGEGVSIEQDS